MSKTAEQLALEALQRNTWHAFAESEVRTILAVLRENGLVVTFKEPGK